MVMGDFSLHVVRLNISLRNNKINKNSGINKG